MKFIFILALSALFLGIFGCASTARDLPVPPIGESGNNYFPQFDEGAAGQAAGQNPEQSQENQEAVNSAGQGTSTPEGGVQYGIPSAQESQEANAQPSNSGSEQVTHAQSKTKYVAYASLFQYGEQSRSKMADVIQKAYAIEVDVSDVSGGIGTDKPLRDPQKAVIRLTGPSTDITLKRGPISQEEYNTLPVSGAWPPFPGYTDLYKSQFFTAKNNALLAGGNYKLTIDADGDGQVDGETELIVPGAQVSNPSFHSRQPDSGFSLQWSSSGNPGSVYYTISTGKGFAGLDNYLAQTENLTSTSLAITPESLDDEGTIETGNYLLNFQAETFQYSDMQDYAIGKSKKKLVFFTLGAKEVHLILYSIGDFCHCEDDFADRPCTVEEVYADPLCQ